MLLEELASHFQLKTQDAIDRLQRLVQEGAITGILDKKKKTLFVLMHVFLYFNLGVIDDRGKFIYISHEEMEAVAKFIRQRGRVSITDLAESSNQLIHLDPTQLVKTNSG